jgi:hypothetical protein
MTPIERFAEIFVRDVREQLARPVSEAARRAHHAGGPSVADLERRITALRQRP